MHSAPPLNGHGAASLACLLVGLMLGGSSARAQEAPVAKAGTGAVDTSTDGAASNLVSVSLQDVALDDAVRMFSRISGVAILIDPSDLQWRVSLNVTDMEWRVALCSVLTNNHLLLVEQTNSGGFYTIERDSNYVPYADSVPMVYGSSPSGGCEPSGFPDFMERLLWPATQIAQPMLVATLGNEDVVTVLCLVIGLLLIFGVGKAIVHNVAWVRERTGISPSVWTRSRIAAGWLTAAALSIIYGFLFGTYAAWRLILRVLNEDGFECLVWGSDARYVYLVPLTVGSLFSILLFALVVGVVLLLSREDRPPRRGVFAVLLALWIASLLFFVVDTAPVRDGFTWKDLPVPPRQARESHDCLQLLIGTNAPPVRLHSPNIMSDDMRTNTLAYAEEIEQAWRNVEPGWTVIHRLDAYDSIADLYELPDPAGDYGPRLQFVPLRNVAQACWAHALLRTAQGRPEEGARALATLHSVIRKALPNARTLIGKMIWTAIGGLTLDAAHTMAVSPACTPEARRILQEAFPPLSPESCSLRVSLTAEYLAARAGLEYVSRVGLVYVMKDWSSNRQSFEGHIRPTLNVGEKCLSRVVTFLAYNPNRTVRDIKTYYDLMILGGERQPPDMAAGQAYEAAYGKRPNLRNLGGYLLASTALPSFVKAVETARRTQVRSDLLAMELHKLNGQELELPDYFTGKRFLVDEKTGELYSPGPDKTPGTHDDVRLSKAW